MSEADASPPRAKVFVALSASAADTRSLQYLLTRLPRLDAASTVVVLQHRDALDEGGFRHALATAGLDLAEVRDGDVVEGGRAYLIGADLVVGVEGGRFRTRPADEVGGRGIIDGFLGSGLDQHQKAMTAARATAEA